MEDIMTNKKKQTDLTIQENPIPKEAESLIAKAIDKNVPVEALERLLAMRRELKAEQAKEEFDLAMAAFQAQCPTIEKTKQGYNYKYADLTAIVEQVKQLLSDNGFSYTFDTDEVENAMIIYCKVKHIGGHVETSKATIHRETKTNMNASQQSGAQMTYGKRYAFTNAFGILTGDEDTDSQDLPKHTPQQTTTSNLVSPDDFPERQIKDLNNDDELAPSETRIEISRLMKEGKIRPNYAKIGTMTNKEAQELLKEVR